MSVGSTRPFSRFSSESHLSASPGFPLRRDTDSRRLSRAKLATHTCERGGGAPPPRPGAAPSLSFAAISHRTAGVAVAVSAMTGTQGRSARSDPSRRYSGRKSCPHSDTQCASSTASSDSPPTDALSRGSAPPLPSASSGRPAHAAAVTAASGCAEPSSAAGMPRPFSAATWSSMSEMSGEMTTAVRPVTSAGTCAGAGGVDERV
eukprot:350390-Chlamydomonas_euryale.AAC.2